MSTSAITGAKVGDRPARIVFDPNTGYKLLWEKKADGSSEEAQHG